MQNITRRNKSNKQTWREYEALVRGTLWTGQPGYTSYKFDTIPSKADVLKQAGDFEQVAAIKIIERVVSVKPLVNLI